MDPEIDELKELVRHQTKVIEDTNKVVHSMRRSARWGRFFAVAWWIAVFAISGAAYYLYLQPYVNQLEKIYGNIQSSGQQAQNWQKEFAQFFKQFSAGQSTTTNQ